MISSLMCLKSKPHLTWSALSSLYLRHANGYLSYVQVFLLYIGCIWCIPPHPNIIKVNVIEFVFNTSLNKNILKFKISCIPFFLINNSIIILIIIIHFMYHVSWYSNALYIGLKEKLYSMKHNFGHTFKTVWLVIWTWTDRCKENVKWNETLTLFLERHVAVDFFLFLLL